MQAAAKRASFRKLLKLVPAIAATVALANPVFAQDSPAPSLDLELNAAQPSQKGCRFTFVAINRLGSELQKAAFEIALFDENGVVQTLTVLDFKQLPVGKTKVTRFDLPGIDCTKVSRVLVNHATECVGPGIDPSACIRSLKTASKSLIEFGI